MNILSLTFHCTENAFAQWQEYTENELLNLVENLLDVDQYIVSEVESEMIREGNNTNLLLFFSTETLRRDFLESELLNIEERITKKFGTDVMVFSTLLNPKSNTFEKQKAAK